MLSNILFNTISYNKNCLFGLVKEKINISLISKMDVNYFDIDNINNHTCSYFSGYSKWCVEHGVITPNDVKFDKDYMYNFSNNWNINTSFNITPQNLSNDINVYTFMSLVNIDSSKIASLENIDINGVKYSLTKEQYKNILNSSNENDLPIKEYISNLDTKIFIARQGDGDLDSIFSIYFDLVKCSDGICGSLVVKINYSSIVNSMINVHTFKYDITNNEFIDKFKLLTIQLNHDDLKIRIFENDKLINSQIIKPKFQADLSLNSSNSKMIVGGHKALKMKNLFIFKSLLTFEHMLAMLKIFNLK